QVLLALRERILRMDVLTDLNRMDDLFRQLGDTLETDMSLDTLYALARLAPKIDRDNIVSYALDWTVLSEISGTTDLEPCVPCVAQIVQEMQMDPIVRRLKEEGARIEVRNGTWVPDLAKNTASYLRAHGFNVVSILQDNRAGHYTFTLILDNVDLPFTRGQLVEQLHTNPAYALVFPDYDQLGILPPEGADILVILGDDYKLPQE
ncbi:MAG: LCP family protein, partial [Chloroflexia bacterium]